MLLLDGLAALWVVWSGSSKGHLAGYPLLHFPSLPSPGVGSLQQTRSCGRSLASRGGFPGTPHVVVLVVGTFIVLNVSLAVSEKRDEEWRVLLKSPILYRLDFSLTQRQRLAKVIVVRIRLPLGQCASLMAEPSFVLSRCCSEAEEKPRRTCDNCGCDSSEKNY